MVFEGLFSPSHLLILGLVIFIVIGPRKIAKRFHRAGESIRQLGEGNTSSAPETDAESDGAPDSHAEVQRGTQQREPSRSAAYRFGRLIRGRHR